MEAKHYSEKLWELLTPFSKTKEGVMMVAAVNLKTAIELYTLVLDEDTDIEHLIVETAVKSIPKLRERMSLVTEDEDDDEPTIH